MIGFGFSKLLKKIDNIGNKIEHTENDLKSRMDAVGRAGQQAMLLAQQASSDITMMTSSVAVAAANSVPVMQTTYSITKMLEGFMVGYGIATVVLAVVAIGRRLYEKLTKEDENIYDAQGKIIGKKDIKEALSEKMIFQIFDAMAISCIIPMLVAKGPGSAIPFWLFLKTVARMVRDAVGSIHLLTSVISPRDSHNPLAGIGFLNKLQETTDEMVNHIEERKEALTMNISTSNPFATLDDEMKEEITDLPPEVIVAQSVLSSPSSSPSMLASSAESLLRAAPMGPHEVSAEQAAKMKSVPWCIACNKVDCKHINDPLYAQFMISSSSKKAMQDKEFQKLKSQWTTVEDTTDFNAIKQGAEKHEWILPVAMFCIFLITITITRWVHGKKKEEKNKTIHLLLENEIKRNNKLALSHVVAGKEQQKTQYLEWKKTQSEIELNEARKRRNPNALYDEKGNRIDQLRDVTELPDHIYMDERGVKHHIDERGHISYLPGARAKQLEANSAVQKQKKVLNKKIRCTRCNRPGHSVADCFSKTQILYNAIPLKENAIVKPLKNEQKEDMTFFIINEDTKKKHQREAILNAPQFHYDNLKESIGWAYAGNADLNAQMNCTAVWNGVVLCKHLFDTAKADEATCFIGDNEFKLTLKDGKLIGNDLLFFRTPKGVSLKYARTAVTKAGAPVALLAYLNKEFRDKRSIAHSEGVTKVVITDENIEKAFATYSSVSGNCAAPVCDEFGRVVGFHNGTSQVDNFFIPITPCIVQKATSSTSSF